MKGQFQSNLDGVRMGGGSIEHPFSIHSASIGTRWKPRGMQLICTLVLLFTFAIGNVWADVLCSATLDGISTNANTDGISQTGCTMKWSGLEGGTSSSIVEVDGVKYYKAGSSGYVQLVLNGTATFQAGDVLTVTLSSNGSNKSVSFKLKNKDSGNGPSDISVSSTEAKQLSYTLVAADIESDGSIKIFRGGSANTNARYGSFSVSREASDPIKVTSVAVTAPANNAEYHVGDQVTLAATVLPANATDKTLNWTMDVNDKATIADGKITFTEAGDFHLTASATDGSNKSNTVHLYVSNPIHITSIALDYDEQHINVGDVITITPTILPANATNKNLLWSVTDGATITQEGVLTAVAQSDVIVTAEAQDGSSISATTHIYIDALPACATLTPAESGSAIAAGDAIDLQETEPNASMRALTTNISYSEYGLKFASSSSTKAEVTLNNLMQVGTVIRATLWSNSTSSARTLKLNNSGGTTKATWSFTPASSSGEEKVFTYTVVAGDGLAGSNVFQLQRGSDVYLRDISIANCGAELYALTSAIYPTEAANKATITLSKNLVAEGATATATYSAIDAAYDFDEWVINGTGASISSASANPVTITMGSEPATITLKLKAAEVKHTVTYYDGETELGTELVVEGENPTATGIAAPKKIGYTFAGWSITNGGDATALSGISVAADMPLYAVYNAVNCSALSGTIFSLILNNAPAANCTIKNASGFDQEADLIKYGTVSGGIALAKNSSTSNHIVITTDPKLRLLGGNGKVHIQFDCALQEGDKIRTTIENQNISYTTTDVRSTTNNFVKGTAKEVTITKDHVLENATEIYLWSASSSDGKLISFEVIRPEKFEVTFNMHDHGDAVAKQYILDGGKVTKPTDPTASGWDFDGWFKESTYDNEWDFANDVVNAATEIHAKWTEHAASSDATLSALSVAGCTLNETFAPATTAYTIDLPFYGTMPVVGDVTATKNDEKAKTPVVSISGNVITIHCEAESGATLDYAITVSTASTPTASSSVNIEQEILDHSKTWGYAAALSAANIAIVDADALDSINESKDYRNEPFLGLKFKKATSKVTIIVPASTELNVKFGSINSAAGLKVSVNGSTPAAPSLTDNVYTLVASEGVKEVVFTLDVKDKTVVLKQVMVGEAIKSVTLPWKVSFNVGGHADAVSPMVWKGTALSLPGVSNVESGYAFEKWNDGSADYLEGADYTPTSNITLNAVYSMTVEDRLAELEFNNEAVAGFSPDVDIYYMTVPYSVAVPQITKAVAIDEAGGATATIQATVWDGDHNYYIAQAYVIPAGGTSTDAKFYQIRFTMDPKLGANIFTAELTSPTAATYSGLYADAENSKIALANDGGKYKFSGSSNYITIALKDGAFAEGDLLKMTYSANPTQGKLALYSSLSSPDSIVSADAPAAFLTLPAGSDAYNVLNIRRTSKNNYNGWVSKVEVLREMDPMIASLKVGEEVATINEGAKTIALELPNSADITAIVPNIVAYANGSATVTPSAAQDFTSGPVNYTVTSLYGETTTYAVSITKAAASSDATLSALTVNGQAIALVDGVFDYSFELPYGTTAAPAVVATAHHVAAVATVDPCTVSGATITVVPEIGESAKQVYTLTFTISAWKEVVIWDGSNMTAVATSPDAITGFAWAVNGFSSITNYNATCGTKAYTKTLPSGGSASASRNIAFTVPAGYVAKFYIAFGTHSDGNNRGMFIGTTATKTLDETSVLTLYSDSRTNLTDGTSEIVGAGTYYLNPMESEDFYEIRAYLRKGMVRNQMLGNGVLGTSCVDHNVAIEDIQGATFYELIGRDYNNYGKLAFDEIVSGELEAGVPYLFQAHGDKMILFYGEDVEPAPVDKGNGMYGTFEQVVFSGDQLSGIYYFAQRALWSCDGAETLTIPANRAYVKLSEIGEVPSSNPAPGRRRVLMNVNGEKNATGFENIEASEKPMKIMINGQIFILRGEKMFDATGRLVK